MSTNGRGLTQAAYARHRAERGLRGISRQAVSKALKTGRIVLNAEGLIDAAEADATWEGGGESRAKVSSFDEGTGGSSVPSGYKKARALREVYSASMAKLRLERERGKLIDRAGVEETWTAVLQKLRDHMLTIPIRVSELLATETDPAEVSRVLTREIREGLDGASRAVG